jgi:hypothetical protein
MPPQSTQANPQAGNVSQHYKYKVGIKVDGKNLSEDELADVLTVDVVQGLYHPTKFTFDLNSPAGPGEEGGVAGKHTNRFTPGKLVEIYFHTSTSESFPTPYAGRALKGYCTRVAADFNNQSNGPIKIIGYDSTYKLQEGIHNRTFLNMKHSEIVRKILNDIGLKNVKIEDTGSPDKYVFQDGITNIAFIRKLSALNGFEFFVQCDDEGDEIVHFRRVPVIPNPDTGGFLNDDALPNSNSNGNSRIITLSWGTDVLGCKPVFKKLPVDYVRVNHWDYEKKETREVKKNRREGTSPTDTRWESGDQYSTNKTATLDVPMPWLTSNPEKNELVARSLCNELQGQFLTCELMAIGNPRIKPGMCVHIPQVIKGDLANFTGNYYVTETRHVYKKGILTTYFTVSDTGGHSLLANNLASENRLKHGQTNLVGIVTDNKDPDNMGRVKIKFPTLEDRESYWARMVMPGAGKGRGFDCLPEVNDEVMVAFEHGDIHRPYIIGGVWNGKDEPPEHVNDSVKDGKVRLRTFKSRVGHEMQFVDENGSKRNKGIYFKTAGGHKFEMDDQEKRILLKTSGGLTIEMNDQSKMIEIKVPGGGNIKLDMKGVSINGL